MTTTPVDGMGYLVPSTLIQSLSKDPSAPSMTSDHGHVKHSLTIGNTDDSGYIILDTTSGTSKKDGVGVQISPKADDEGYLVPDMVLQRSVMSPRASYTKDHDHDSDSAVGNTPDASLQDYYVGSEPSYPKSPLRSDDEDEVFLVAGPASYSRSGYNELDKEEGKHGEDSELCIP